MAGLSKVGIKIKLTEVYKGVKIEVEASGDNAFEDKTSSAVRKTALMNLQWTKDAIAEQRPFVNDNPQPTSDKSWDELTDELKD